MEEEGGQGVDARETPAEGGVEEESPLSLTDRMDQSNPGATIFTRPDQVQFLQYHHHHHQYTPTPVVPPSVPVPVPVPSIHTSTHQPFLDITQKHPLLLLLTYSLTRHPLTSSHHHSLTHPHLLITHYHSFTSPLINPPTVSPPIIP